MASNFRNELAKVPLRKDIRSDRPGGNLKPDVLGIALTAKGLVIELVEVTTFEQAAKTLVDDIENKLRALREKVLKEDASTLENEYFLRSGARTLLSVGPSKWRPAWDQMVFPLPPQVTSAASDNGVKRVEWICFWPTFRFNPAGTGGTPGVDGLILYEIHSVQLPEPVPQQVLDRMREEARRKAAQQRIALRQLSLTPWITEEYWKRNASDRDVLLAGVAIAGVAILALLAIEFLPIILAGGAVAEGSGAVGAVATTTTEAAAIAARVRGAAALAGQVMQSLGTPIEYGALP